MKTLIQYFIFCMILLFSMFSLSEGDLEERTIEVITDKIKNLEVIKEAEQQLTNTLILELVGEENYEKMIPSLEKKIYPNTKKFILLTKKIDSRPYIKSYETDIENGPNLNLEEESPQEQMRESSSLEVEEVSLEDHFVYNVLVRFSLRSLKEVLIKENLFYVDNSANRILTLISIEDHKEDQTYSWWDTLEEKFKTLSFYQQARAFYKDIQSVFLSHGFYMPNPIFSRYKDFLTRRWSKNIRPRDAQKIADQFDAQIMVLGYVSLDEKNQFFNKITWNLIAYHASSLRKLGQYYISKKWKHNHWDFLKNVTGAEVIAKQLSQLYNKGILSTDLFTIELRGLRSFKERDKVKKALIRQIRSIKNLTELFITSDIIQYSANVSISEQKLLQQVNQMKLTGFDISSYLKDRNHLILRLSYL